MPRWGYCTMPLVDGDHLILIPGGKGGDLAAVEQQDGKVDLAKQGVHR